MCFLKCARALPVTVSPLQVYLSRGEHLFLPLSLVNLTQERAVRLRSFLRCSLRRSLTLAPFVLPTVLSLSIYPDFFSTTLSAKKHPRPYSEIYCSRSIIHSEIVLGAETMSNYEELNFSHKKREIIISIVTLILSFTDVIGVLPLRVLKVILSLCM